MYNKNILEEELKNKVAEDWFKGFDTTQIIGKIDFCIAVSWEHGTLFNVDALTVGENAQFVESLLWAEAKKGTSHDIYESFVQLILTIGRARTIDKYLPPKFLGAFDAEKIAFLPYSKIMDVFSQNDFDWTVTSSNHTTKEFKQLYNTVETTLLDNSLLFNYTDDADQLREFIKKNFILGKGDISKTQINKNNFVNIYNRWAAAVKPTIRVDWEAAKRTGILDADFYLADILSQENSTIVDKLFVLLRSNHYELDRKMDALGFEESKRIGFSDRQKAHRLFWARYERPPRKEYWDMLVNRRDLLVPQDVRERKGSFFTPQRWVELSQQYIADTLGEDWQDEYTVWDCCAGTGNLLAGLTNKYNIWASTLDKADVEAMKERISNGANLLESHVFQFDFLNDDFSKLPKHLLDIINDEKKRKKLLIYINPPYAEATNTRTISGTGTNKAGTSINNKIYEKYKNQIGKASNELYAQFLTRIYFEIPSCVLANFSTLKNLQAPNFSDFRQEFRAKLEKIFLVPANTFDNVKGQFPIGFFIWDTNKKEIFKKIYADAYNAEGIFIRKKKISTDRANISLNNWIVIFCKNIKKEDTIGLMSCYPADFQNQIRFSILSQAQQRYCLNISKDNLIEISVYFAVRKVIPADWLNDRDQFLYPNDGWQTDKEFQNNCLAYTLFNNNIQSKQGVNNWIPFTETEVDAKEKFASNFMTDFMAGKLKPEKSLTQDLFIDQKQKTLTKHKLEFSPTAQNVFAAGRELWRYYHSKPKANVNASLYDIREYFQGRNNKGKMNNTSQDEKYNQLIAALRQSLKTLAKQIEPKVYEYGFLK